MAEGGGGSSCPGCSVRRVPDHIVVQAQAWGTLPSLETPVSPHPRAQGPPVSMETVPEFPLSPDSRVCSACPPPWPSPPQGGNTGPRKRGGLVDADGLAADVLPHEGGAQEQGRCRLRAVGLSQHQQPVRVGSLRVGKLAFQPSERETLAKLELVPTFLAQARAGGHGPSRVRLGSVMSGSQRGVGRWQQAPLPILHEESGAPGRKGGAGAGEEERES